MNKELFIKFAQKLIDDTKAHKISWEKPKAELQLIAQQFDFIESKRYMILKADNEDMPTAPDVKFSKFLLPTQFLTNIPTIGNIYITEDENDNYSLYVSEKDKEYLYVIKKNINISSNDDEYEKMFRLYAVIRSQYTEKIKEYDFENAVLSYINQAD